jgi:hypothetical protein
MAQVIEYVLLRVVVWLPVFILVYNEVSTSPTLCSLVETVLEIRLKQNTV